jgi:hypothetical protein
MGVFNEYINNPLSLEKLEEELKMLLSVYKNLTGRQMFVYTPDFAKQGYDISLTQEDFYIIHDLLHQTPDNQTLDFYIETPGGSGEAAEEIVRFLRKKFNSISFIIAGEAKSAGTLIALSGDEIYMTETGSLGPIDAQVFIARTMVSAHDYMEWVEKTRNFAAHTNYLNPFDATIIAQINPGEIGHVSNALHFAIDLVQEWLCKYKFATWQTTETSGSVVTEEIKKDRAKQIATDLTNHSRWRSHGRSIKAEDLADLGLKINLLDKTPEIADIVYRIKAVLHLIFLSSPVFKIFAFDDIIITKQAQQRETNTP